MRRPHRVSAESRDSSGDVLLRRPLPGCVNGCRVAVAGGCCPRNRRRSRRSGSASGSSAENHLGFPPWRRSLPLRSPSSIRGKLRPDGVAATLAAPGKSAKPLNWDASRFVPRGPVRRYALCCEIKARQGVNYEEARARRQCRSGIGGNRPGRLERNGRAGPTRSATPCRPARSDPEPGRPRSSARAHRALSGSLLAQMLLCATDPVGVVALDEFLTATRP